MDTVWKKGNLNMFEGKRRKTIFSAVVGSHNYNLNTETSDMDAKEFIMPLFEELFHKQSYSKSKVTPEMDVEVKDIRELVSLLWKANLNYLEVLYSVGFTYNTEFEKEVQKIVAMRDDIATMNPQSLYKAAKGTYFNRSKYIDTGTENTMHLLEKFGYDTKNAMQSYRLLDFITRLYSTGDFIYALRYSEQERDFMLKMKTGGLSREEFDYLFSLKLKEFETLEDWYVNQECDLRTKEELTDVVMEIVKKGIREEI